MSFINSVRLPLIPDLTAGQSIELRSIVSINVIMLSEDATFEIENEEGDTQTWTEFGYGFALPNARLDYLKVTCLTGTIRVIYFTTARKN